VNDVGGGNLISFLLLLQEEAFRDGLCGSSLELERRRTEKNFPKVFHLTEIGENLHETLFLTCRRRLFC